MMNLHRFFERLWQNYCAITPQASKIHALFERLDGPVHNDHIALRTIDHGPFALEALEPYLFELGYQRLAPYSFPAKKLNAWSYQAATPGWPLIFFSQLELGQLSTSNQQRIESLLSEAGDRLPHDARAFFSGSLWPRPSWSDYCALEAESDYAAWFSIWGLRANHFTIDINRLKRYSTLQAVVELLEQQGFALNQSGGLIKGSPQALLEQSATLADQQTLYFSDGEHAVPSCYYEFAKRYPGADGTLFQGFVPSSADKIFHSTHRNSRT